MTIATCEPAVVLAGKRRGGEKKTLSKFYNLKFLKQVSELACIRGCSAHDDKLRCFAAGGYRSDEKSFKSRCRQRTQESNVTPMDGDRGSMIIKAVEQGRDEIRAGRGLESEEVFADVEAAIAEAEADRTAREPQGPVIGE